MVTNSSGQKIETTRYDGRSTQRISSVINSLKGIPYGIGYESNGIDCLSLIHKYLKYLYGFDSPDIFEEVSLVDYHIHYKNDNIATMQLYVNYLDSICNAVSNNSVFMGDIVVCTPKHHKDSNVVGILANSTSFLTSCEDLGTTYLPNNSFSLYKTFRGVRD